MPVDVAAFYAENSGAITYVAGDRPTRVSALIDGVVSPRAGGAIGPSPLQPVIAHARQNALTIRWIVETHVHADHLSGAAEMKQIIGGETGIGARVVEVQRRLSSEFALPAYFRADGSQSDRLLQDPELLPLGESTIRVLSTPGHTPACVSYAIGGCVFVGETLFMPSAGSARCDFPGGDARQLYRSVRKLPGLPASSRIFTAHDYGPSHGQPPPWEGSVAQQRASNIRARDGVSEDQFVQMREQRDCTLSPPAL